MTTVTFAFRSVGKFYGNDVGRCRVRKCDAYALVGYLKKYRKVAVPQVTEKVNVGRDQTVSARTVHPQLHREEYYSRAAEHKLLRTKANTLESSVV